MHTAVVSSLIFLLVTLVGCAEPQPTPGPVDAAAAGCTYQDEPHEVGDVWSAGDGCNSCSCISDGEWRCSLIGCDGGLPSDAGMDAAALTR